MSTTLAPVTITAFPRVDLLPPEIGEERKFRSVRAILGAVVLLSVFVVGALYYLAHSQVGDAQANLTSAQYKSSVLRTQIAKYAYVPQVYAEVASAQAELNQATATEIHYSFLLNDLSVQASANKNVTLTALQITQPFGKVPQGAWGTAGIGTLTAQGTATKQADVASWLASLGLTKNLGDPYLVTSTANKSTGTVTFSGQALVLPSALVNPPTRPGVK